MSILDGVHGTGWAGTEDDSFRMKGVYKELGIPPGQELSECSRGGHMRHATPRMFRRHSWSMDRWEKSGVRAGDRAAGILGGRLITANGYNICDGSAMAFWAENPKRGSRIL
jgi:hypothetical protein